MKKFYKTVITVTVLSEYGPVCSDSDLSEVARQIDTGDWVGRVAYDGGTELTGKEAADALAKMGSSSSFFQLDDDGRSEGDEDTLTWRVWDGQLEKYVFVSQNEDDARVEYARLCERANGMFYVDLSREDGETVETNGVAETRNGLRGLCNTCDAKGHDTCGNDASCPCCRQAHEGVSR